MAGQVNGIWFSSKNRILKEKGGGKRVRENGGGKTPTKRLGEKMSHKLGVRALRDMQRKQTNCGGKVIHSRNRRSGKVYS